MFNKINIPLRGVAKPRMTRRDRWAKRDCVVNYWDYCDKLRCFLPNPPPIDSIFTITFIFDTPNSWSKKKKDMNVFQKHMQRPDFDNLGKAFFDALYKEDSGAWNVRIKKIWGNEDKIILEWK